jgi:hypothetical protein
LQTPQVRLVLDQQLEVTDDVDEENVTDLQLLVPGSACPAVYRLVIAEAGF